MRKITKSVFTLSSLVLATLMVVSCNSGQSTNKASKKEIEKDVKKFVYPLPTSFEVTEMLNRIGAAYILTLSNPASNVSKYMTEKSQALNLGVYGADLSYSSTYRQKEETMGYMKASKVLIEELSISSAIDPDIIDKIEQNADDKDALVKLITDSFYSTYNYLQTNNRGGVSSIIMAGSWVEALYIATHISEDTFNNKEMVKIVMDQKEPLSKLYEILGKEAQNPDVQETMNELKPLKDIYDSIDGAISEEQLTSITETVKAIRDKITL